MYKNVLFRSRTEARWALFFDLIDRDNWIYEPDTFKLSNGELYLPDFKFSDNIYVEIKPYVNMGDVYDNPIIEKTFFKAWQFAKDSGVTVILLSGIPGENIPIYIEYFNNGSPYSLKPTKDGVAIMEIMDFVFNTPNEDGCGPMGLFMSYTNVLKDYWEDKKEIVEKVKGYRFYDFKSRLY